MNRELWLLAALGLGFTSESQAEVYRCEKDGKLEYSDRPCVKGDAPVALPPLSTVHRDTSERSLAKQYDRDSLAARRAKASADAEWKKSYSSRKKTEARVQEGRIKGEIVVGMSEQQVHALLGEPDSQRGNQTASGSSESWTYRAGSKAQTIQFKDGKVTQVTHRDGKSARSGHRR